MFWRIWKILIKIFILMASITICTNIDLIFNDFSFPILKEIVFWFYVVFSLILFITLLYELSLFDRSRR